MKERECENNAQEQGDQNDQKYLKRTQIHIKYSWLGKADWQTLSYLSIPCTFSSTKYRSASKIIKLF